MNMTPSQAFVGPLGAGRLARLAPFFIIGPVSGPLTAGLVLNLRGGRPVLASLYGVALGLWLTVVPLWTAAVLPGMAARLF
jgi:hypothetical protein